METRTFEDYQNKKFFVTSDFKTYKWNEKGEITDIDAIITNETWNQIANYLKNQFYNEVDRVTEIWKGKFIAEYKINYDIKHLHKAETKTVIQILRGKKNKISDTFGTTHEVISYVNSMPVVLDNGIKLKLSPVFSLQRSTIMEIRKYMIFEYNRPKQDREYIQNIKFHNRFEPYILAEALMKYLNFLNEYSINTKPIEQSFKPSITGFQSKLTDEAIDKLYSLMQVKYIDTSPDNWRAIFKSKPVPASFIPITLLKPFTNVLCAYFVCELFQKENPTDYWKIAESCFSVKNLKQSLNNCSNNPKCHKVIDNIILSLKNPLPPLHPLQ